MAVYDILPQTNLRADDIRDTLNAGGGSVTNNTLSFFSDAANINMFSRYKPIRLYADFVNLWEDNAWKGTDGQCGINFIGAVLSSYTKVVGNVDSDSYNGWTYQKPWAGVDQRFRLGDFRGYCAKAIPPANGFAVSEKVAVGGTLHAMIAYNASIEPGEGYSPGSLGLGEFSYGGKEFSQWHFGIVVTDPQNKVKGRSFSGGGISSCTYSVSGLSQGVTYKAWPLLAMEEMGQAEGDKVNTYMQLPLCGPKEFKVVSAQEAAGLSIVLNAEYIYLAGKKTRISYTLTISTDRTAPALTNNYIQMRFSTSNLNDGLKVGESMKKLPDISVSKDSPYTTFGSFTIDSNYADMEYYLYGTFNSSQYNTGKVYPIQEMIPPEL